MILILIIGALTLLFNWLLALSLVHGTMMLIVETGVSMGTNIILLIALGYVLVLTWTTSLMYKITRSLMEK